MGGYYTKPQEGKLCRYCGHALLKDKTCCNPGCLCTEQEEELDALRAERDRLKDDVRERDICLDKYMANIKAFQKERDQLADRLHAIEDAARRFDFIDIEQVKAIADSCGSVSVVFLCELIDAVRGLRAALSAPAAASEDPVRVAAREYIKRVDAYKKAPWDDEESEEVMMENALDTLRRALEGGGHGK